MLLNFMCNIRYLLYQQYRWKGCRGPSRNVLLCWSPEAWFYLGTMVINLTSYSFQSFFGNKCFGLVNFVVTVILKFKLVTMVEPSVIRPLWYDYASIWTRQESRIQGIHAVRWNTIIFLLFEYCPKPIFGCRLHWGTLLFDCKRRALGLIWILLFNFNSNWLVILHKVQY